MGRSFIWGLQRHARCAVVLAALGCIDLTPPYRVLPDGAVRPSGSGGHDGSAAGNDGMDAGAALGDGSARPGEGGAAGEGGSTDPLDGGSADGAPTSMCMDDANRHWKLWDFETGADLFPSGARGMPFELVGPSEGSQTLQTFTGAAVACGTTALRYAAVVVPGDAGVRGLFAPRVAGELTSVDASGHRGIRFLYRSGGTPLTFRVQTAAGRYKFAVEGATEWRTQLVTFTQLAVDGTGTPADAPATVDKTKLQAIEWILPSGARQLDLDQIWYFK